MLQMNYLKKDAYKCYCSTVKKLKNKKKELDKKNFPYIIIENGEILPEKEAPKRYKTSNKI